MSGISSSVHAALIETMVLMAVADRTMSDNELRAMQDIVGFLPAFANFDHAAIETIATSCTELLEQENGIDIALERIKADLPPAFRETAYALACDVIAADGTASQEELRLLELLAVELEIDRLAAAGIERGARARFRRL